jgi:hypothetical protein
MLSYFCGYSIKVWLLNNELKRHDIYITPWFGLAVIVMAFYLLYRLDVSVETGKYFFIFAILIANTLTFFLKKEAIHATKKELVLTCAILLVVLFLYGVVYLVNDSRSYVYVLNTDFLSYLNTAKFVAFNSISDVNTGVPSMAVIQGTIEREMRGGVFFIALVSRLLNFDIAKSIYPLMIMVLLFNILAFRPFLKGRNYAIILLTVLCLNSFYQWTVLFATLGQLFSLGNTAIAILLFSRLIEKDDICIKDILLLFIVLTAQGYYYIEALAYPLIPIVVYCIIRLIKRTFDIPFAKKIGVLASVFCIANVSQILFFFRRFSDVDDFPMNWNWLPRTSLFDISGLFSLHDSLFATFNPATSLFSSKALIFLANIVIIIILVVQIRREKPSSFLSIVLFTNLGLLILFEWRYWDDLYKVHKGAINLAYIVLVFLIRFFEKAFTDRKNYFARMSKIVFSVWFLLCIFSTAVNIAGTTGSGISIITEDHAALYNVSQDHAYASSRYITNCSGPENRRAEYFLPSGRTYSLEFTDARSPFQRGIITEMLDGDIYIENTRNPDIFAVEAERIFQNNLYSAYKLNDSSIFLSEWNGLGGLRTQEKKNNDVIILNSSRKVVDNRVEFTFLSNVDRSETCSIDIINESDDDVFADIFFNDICIRSGEQISRTGEYNLENINIIAGKNTLKIVFDHIPSATMVRNLHFTRFASKYEIPLYEKPDNYAHPFKRVIMSLYTKLHPKEISISVYGAMSGLFLGDGWYDGLVDNTRWTGESATIQFWADDKVPLLLQIQARTFEYSGDTIVFINDKQIGTIHPPITSELLIPSATLNSEGFQVLRLENTKAVAPSDVSDSTDTRTLGLRVNKIIMTPKNIQN